MTTRRCASRWPEQLELHARFASLDATAPAAARIMRQERFRPPCCSMSIADMNGHELCREMRRAGSHVPCDADAAGQRGRHGARLDAAPRIMSRSPFG